MTCGSGYIARAKGWVPPTTETRCRSSGNRHAAGVVAEMVTEKGDKRDIGHEAQVKC